MAYSISLVAITPASFRDTAEQLGIAMGHSGNEFTVPLTSDGQSITHYGIHAWVTPEAAAVWMGEAYPPDTGYTNEQIDAVRSQLIISIDNADSEGTTLRPSEHFNKVLTENDLIPFEETE